MRLRTHGYSPDPDMASDPRGAVQPESFRRFARGCAASYTFAR